jgi:hypothetical protein
MPAVISLAARRAATECCGDAAKCGVCARHRAQRPRAEIIRPTAKCPYLRVLTPDGDELARARLTHESARNLRDELNALLREGFDECVAVQ